MIKTETEPSINNTKTWRISDVVQETGISKELIHHYLRLGLLPKSDSRGRYDSRQLRLLQQVKKLRDNHNLPLDVMRRIFSLYNFDPTLIESLTHSESLCKRMTEFALGSSLIPAGSLTAEEAAETAGIPGELLKEYVNSRLITPQFIGGEERYSVFDAHIMALCHRGVEMGIPFESFQTIASHVRLAFELEHSEFYNIYRESEPDAEQMIADFFIRREVSISFVQNVLHALTELRFKEVMQHQSPKTSTVDRILYQPSDNFMELHRLEEYIGDIRENLCRTPDDRNLWLSAAEALLHASRYREAAFFLEESLEKWPNDCELQSAYGRTLVLSDEFERGRQFLNGAVNGNKRDPRCLAFIAFSIYMEAKDDSKPESLLRKAVTILKIVKEAIRNLPDRKEAPDVEAALLCGWLLTALPPVFQDQERGLAILSGILRDMQNGMLSGKKLPGLNERYFINAAYMIVDCLDRNSSVKDGNYQPADSNGDIVKTEGVDIPSIEELKTLICRHDPGSAFAKEAFMLDAAPRNAGRMER